MGNMDRSRDQTASAYKQNTDYLRNNYLRPTKVKSFSPSGSGVERGDAINDMKEFQLRRKRKETDESSASNQMNSLTKATITPFSGMHSKEHDHDFMPPPPASSDDKSASPVRMKRQRTKKKKKKNRQRQRSKVQKQNVSNSPRIIYNDDASEKYQAYNDNP